MSSTVTVSAVSSSPFTVTIGGGGSGLMNVTEDARTTLSSTQQPISISSFSSSSSTPQPSPDVWTAQTPSLSLPYVASETIVAILAILGNALVVYVFCTNRSLRRYRNYYIVGLAVADFLVGLLGIPLAVLASVGLPQKNLYGCLFAVSILMVLCTISILCLVAVSIDRYWATTNPFAYYRNMTTSTAVGIILTCWFVGAIIGFLPLFGWYNSDGWTSSGEFCYFTKVVSYSYLVFLYFATIVFPALLMAGFYGYIYHVVLIKIRQKGTLVPQGGRRQSEASRSGSLNSDNRGSTQMMRIMQSEKRREGKAAKKLGIIVLFFMICWMPLYTINCIQAFFVFPVPEGCMYIAIILSHANSALNPFLYAYHLKEFRLAMKNALCACFGRVLCGLVNTPDQKDSFGVVSRSQTMPSLANASLSTQTGKFSIKFRKVSAPQSSSDGQGQRVSPKSGGVGGVGGGISMMSPTPSRDNIFHPLSTADKSMTSLSLITEPLASHLPSTIQQQHSIYSQNHFPRNHNQNQQHHKQQNKEESFSNFSKSPSTDIKKCDIVGDGGGAEKLTTKIKGILSNSHNHQQQHKDNCNKKLQDGHHHHQDDEVLETEVEPHHVSAEKSDTAFNHDSQVTKTDDSDQVVLNWKGSQTLSVEL